MKGDNLTSLGPKLRADLFILGGNALTHITWKSVRVVQNKGLT